MVEADGNLVVSRARTRKFGLLVRSVVRDIYRQYAVTVVPLRTDRLGLKLGLEGSAVRHLPNRTQLNLAREWCVVDNARVRRLIALSILGSVVCGLGAAETVTIPRISERQIAIHELKLSNSAYAAIRKPPLRSTWPATRHCRPCRRLAGSHDRPPEKIRTAPRHARPSLKRQSSSPGRRNVHSSLILIRQRCLRQSLIRAVRLPTPATRRSTPAGRPSYQSLWPQTLSAGQATFPVSAC